MLRLVALGALVALASAQTTEVQPCSRFTGDLPINAHIHGCSNPPCDLPQLEDAIISLIFRAPRTMRTMTTLATAVSVNGLPTLIPYPLRENAITCNFLENSYCPVLEGEILQYTLRMYISPTFEAGVRPTIEFRIADDNGTNFICIRAPLVILQPRQQAALNGTLADKY